MLRGVNRRVVEINECKSELFERAIFFVRPSAANPSSAQLHKEAHAIIESLSNLPPPQHKKKYRISRRALWLFLGLSLAVSIISIIFNII